MTTPPITLKEQRAKEKAAKQERRAEKRQQAIDEVQKTLSNNPDVAKTIVADENAPNWDDLNTLHKECLGLVAGMGDIATILRNPKIAESSKASQITTIVSTLTTDIKAFLNTVTTIKTQHENRSGKLDENGDNAINDLAEMFRISNEYERVMSRFQDAVIPLFFDLQGIVNEIEGTTTTDPIDG